MIFIKLFIYWIFSTIFIRQSLILSGDNLKTRVIIGNISIFFGWLILPAACIYCIYKILKKKFT